MCHWFNNAIIYHILIDRFAGFNSTDSWDQNRFIGGNIKGIIDKLDYIDHMGFNTIWISPFYSTSAYHGYHITDFNKVDPHFGTLYDLQNLILLASQKNIRIIADFVPNHCSRYHPWFIDTSSKKTSQYYNWFYFKNWPKEYLCFLHFGELPKLNLENEDTARELIRSAVYWAKLGIKGFRIDHVIGIPHSFLQRLKDELKKIDPEFVLIGEAWGAGLKYRELPTVRIKSKYRRWRNGLTQDSLQLEYQGILDGVLDFEFRELLMHYFRKANSLSNLTKQLQKHYSQYNPEFVLPTFLDNHDLPRVHSILRRKNLMRAFEIQFSLPHPPIIYYGTESGLSHQHHQGIFSDVLARKPMPWERLDEQLIEHVHNLIKKRRT